MYESFYTLYLQSCYHCSTYLSAQPNLCSAPLCYLLFICCHPLSTTYIFSKNHQSLISLCITSSLESTYCLIPSALHKSTLLMTSHTLIHLSTAHHSHPPLHTHYFIPGSILTFSTNLFHHSLLAPTWTAFLWLYCMRLTLLNSFSFLVIFLFISGRAVD